ncbi:MAG: NAD(P)-dependent oxidoreductase [Dehalococcoidales bacterium]|nr:NAD(P)-dependent oxidoreductase [Dehalococcoidales bacterium]
MKKKVVVTGIAGCIGSVLYNNLKDKWEITGIGRRESTEYPVTVADISDASSLDTVFSGAYAVIHLAANAHAWAEWKAIEGPNITGTENVFRAARESGVKKVIFASSNHATGLYENDEPYCRIVKGDYTGLVPSKIPQIDHTMPLRPDGYYGVSKVFGEALGRYYAEKHGMQVICLRIGTVNRENRPWDVRQFATLFQYKDLVKMTDKCLLDDTIGFEVFYGVSNNKWRFWDVSHVRDCLGWMPEEDTELMR